MLEMSHRVNVHDGELLYDFFKKITFLFISFSSANKICGHLKKKKSPFFLPLS